MWITRWKSEKPRKNGVENAIFPHMVNLLILYQKKQTFAIKKLKIFKGIVWEKQGKNKGKKEASGRGKKCFT